MRILLATETYFPTISGVVIFTQNLAEELVARGHEVAIFAPSANGLYHVQRKGGISLYYFPSLPNPFRMETRIVVQQYSKVEMAFEEFNPDVVHLQTPSGVPVSVQKSAKKMGVPIVATQHFLIDFILQYLKPLAFMSPITHMALVMFVNHFLAQCDYITCPTESIKQALLRDGVAADFSVISNGIRIEHFAKKPTTTWDKIPQDRPIVLHIGRLDQDKNIPMLLESVPWVLRTVPKALFVIAGSGSYVAKARKWVAEQGLEDSVLFIGRVPHGSKHMIQMYHQADVFAIPSNIETQSLVTMQAVACSLPIVAANVGALPELVHNDVNGFLIKRDDVAGFAEKIAWLLLHPAKAKAMGKAGDKIIAMHRMDSVVKEFLAVYEKSIAEKKAALED